MGLTCIYGNSGSGKSEYLYKKIIEEAALYPFRQYFLVVPEQFTLQTQKSLVSRTSNHVILNIDVVSFERLAFRIFDELGLAPTVLEETGKSLILRKLAKDQELGFLKSNMKKSGYIEEVKSVLSEFMQYKVTPDMIEALLETLDQDKLLYHKLSDIHKIYWAFSQYLSDSIVTAEKLLDLLGEYVDQSDRLHDSVLAFDGFTGFTPVQMQLIGALLPVCKDLWITVTMDSHQKLEGVVRKDNLFYMSRTWMDQLRELDPLHFSDPVCFPPVKTGRFQKNPVLFHLEQNLFRIPSVPFSGKTDQEIQISALMNPKAELRYAASKIREYCRTESFHYRDFAIITGNSNVYTLYARDVLEDFEIPFFSDKKETILFHPMTELILSTLEIVQNDFSMESMCRFLKTGLTSLTVSEVDELENYIMARGIRGYKKWNQKFTIPFYPRKSRKETEEAASDRLERLNSSRSRIIERLRPVYQVCQKDSATVREITVVLYQLLTELCVAESLEKQAQDIELSGDLITADSFSQVCRIIIDLLDKYVELLSEEVVGIEEYKDILRSGFEAARVGVVPPGNDCVILGDIERTRLDDIKVLFFLGVNDTNIPKKNDRGGILSQFDREALRDRISLAPTQKEQMFIQKFYLYLLLTKPSRKLHLSYARLDGTGTVMRPSYLIKTIQNLFPKLEIEHYSDSEMGSISSPKGSLDTYVRGLNFAMSGEVVSDWIKLHHWYQSQEEYRETIRELYQSAFTVKVPDQLSKQVAKELYGVSDTYSVSRLEKFAECPQAYFLQYGLHLEERRVSSVNAADLGSIYHDMIYRYCTKVETFSSWKSLSEEEQIRYMNEAINEVIEEDESGCIEESARRKSLLNAIHNMMENSMKSLTGQIQRGEFLPIGYEKSFSQTVDTDGHYMNLFGIMDRMDEWEKDGIHYIRIVDYKSGNKEFDLNQFYYGLQLQLISYLSAGIKSYRKQYPNRSVYPGGVFYFQIQNPLLNKKYAPGDIAEQIFAQYRLNGIINHSSEVIQAMDRELQPMNSSDVIPVSMKKDGSLRSSSHLYAPEQFLLLESHAKRLLQQIGSEIMDGRIDVYPYAYKQKTACDYCGYRTICGLDRKTPGFEYHELAEWKGEEIMKKLKEENE